MSRFTASIQRYLIGRSLGIDLVHFRLQRSRNASQSTADLPAQEDQREQFEGVEGGHEDTVQGWYGRPVYLECK